MKEIIVKNENDAWTLLEKILKEKQSNEFIQLKFDNWPKLEITLKGNKFNSTLNTKLMEGFLEVQKAINIAYAKLRYDRSTQRILSEDDKCALEFSVKVKQGSTVVEALLDSPFVKFAQEVVSTMDGSQVMITVLGSALLFSTTSCFKSYMQKQKETKDSEKQISLSEEETKRMKIFSDAINKSQQLQSINNDVEEVYNCILRGSLSADQVEIGGLKLVKNEIKEVLRKTRTKSTGVQLNGKYKILAIDNTNIDHYRVDLEYEDGRIFKAKLDDDCLIVKEQNKVLIDKAFWDRTSIYLLVNASELRGEITQAKVIDVRDRFIKGMHDVNRR